jgi:hypothetical protein
MDRHHNPHSGGHLHWVALGDSFFPGGAKASAFHDLGHSHHCGRSLLGRPQLAEVKRLSEELRKRALQPSALTSKAVLKAAKGRWGLS